MLDNYIFAGNQKRCLGCMELYDRHFDVCPHCGYTEERSGISLLHLAPGTILKNRYLVGRTLGYGGFGVTYLAFDNKLQRKVAIKEYLPSEYATRRFQDPNVVIEDSEKRVQQFNAGMNKFLEEGKRLAEVGNIDNVVHMYECFEANSTAYIVMEYLEGMTLAEYLDSKGTLSQNEMLEIMLPLMASLSQVHEIGIIHRDISPDNILLTNGKDGKIVAKLIDFGAAKYAVVARSSKSLTVLVNKGYSPEEQYRSKGSQGTFTDVYALSAVMYKMLTGVKPPDALERRANIEKKKRDKLQKISKYNKDVSENVENAILNGLNVKVEDRSATVDELVGELISFERVKRRGVTIGILDPLSWPLWARICVPLATAAAVAILVFAVNRIFTDPNFMVSLPAGMTRVPEFISSPFDEAVANGEKAFLQVKSVSDEYTPGGKSDIVLTQDLSYGVVVPENSLVSVTVSTGKQFYVLPDVKGYDLEYARYALECMGMEVLVKEGSEAGLADNAVISQSIEAYTEVNTGETITLVVNKAAGTGKEKKSFSPEGGIYEDILSKASAEGVRCRIVEKVFSDNYKDYEVIDSVYSEDGILELTVAIPTREFSMPNLRYKNQDIAIQLLKNIGIEGSVEIDYNDAIAENLVYDQETERGEILKTNGKILLRVSRGGKPFTMPSFIGIASKDAEKQMSELKLAAKVEYGYSSEFKEGEVYQQSVDAGSDVRRGDEIILYVCSTASLIKVADVTGKEQKDAVSILEGQKLAVQVVEVFDDTIEKGHVINQLPAAGTLQQENTTIVLTVSKGSNKPIEKSNETSDQGAGPWSSLVATLPTDVSSKDYDIEQVVQYRSRKRETTTGTQASLDGWTLYDQKEAWGDYGNWSDWSTEKKAASDSVKVQSKTQYSIKNRSTTTSNTNDTMSGWRLYDTDEGWSDYGSWSSWSEQPVSGDDYTKVESKKQYRYQDKATTTSTTSSTMPGWTLYDTKTEWGPYGNWSSWSVTQPTASESVKVESKTQYRYRDKETTKSENSSMSGWTLYDTKEEWGPYGEWSEWSNNAVSSSESTKVETEQQFRYRDKEFANWKPEEVPKDQGWQADGTHNIEYGSWSEWSEWQSGSWSADSGWTPNEHDLESSDTKEAQVKFIVSSTYGHRKCNNCGYCVPMDSDLLTSDNPECPSCKVTSATISEGYSIPLYYYNSFSEFNSHHDKDVVEDSEGTYFLINSMVSQTYRIRTRDKFETYGYYRWGEWSPWQADFQYIFSSDDRQEESRTAYRYCTRKKVPMYYYERYSDWSSWLDYSVSTSATRKVETRTVYRSASREKVNTNYFYKWNDWSKWGDTSYSQSATRNVETRTVYRSRKRSKKYTYYFEKWSDWSNWGDVSYTKDENRDVRTRTVYSYASRKKQYTYYFERWGEWSSYGTEPISSSDSVDVQTRVVYRYRTKAK